MAHVRTDSIDVAWFERVYADAAGDAAAVPWSDGRPHPALVVWLNAVAPSIIRCGARVAVVGCGLGEDAREMIRRGYETTAFDCAPTAVAWERHLDPDNAGRYHEADLFDPPSRWRHRFDLVVEINTLQAIDPGRRESAVRSLTDLVAPHGRVLVICRAAAESGALVDGPPWPLAPEELVAAFAQTGMAPDGPITPFLDAEDPPVLRLRALFSHAV
jgi:SAM-dependent methyltransferase